jgi:hypothetical protein
VFSVALAFIVPRLFWMALLVQIASTLSYVAFLFRTENYGVSVDQRFLALLMFGALLIALREFTRSFGLLDLLAQQRPPPAPPADGGRPEPPPSNGPRADDGPALSPALPSPRVGRTR